MGEEEETFRATRHALLCDIAQDLGDVVSSMETLNRNLECVTAEAADLETISDVWCAFQTRVSAR